MNLSKLEEHYELIERFGFITNCPPNVNLEIYHDQVGVYCEHLNSLALLKRGGNDAQYSNEHFNEPAGDYIAIYKIEGGFREKAMNVLNEYSETCANEDGSSRSWRK